MTDALTPLRPRLAAAAALALLASGCGMLRTSPGDDFQVLLFSTPDAVGRIEVPLQFGVGGCPSFTAEVEGALGRHAIDFVPDVDGTWRANVPVEWLRGEDGTCLHDAASPLRSKAKLLVTCTDVGRTAAAELQVSYATASHAYAQQWPVQLRSLDFITPSADPDRPYMLIWDPVVAVSYVDPTGWSDYQYIDGFTYAIDPLVRPRLASQGARHFINAGCNPRAGCASFELSPGVSVAGEWIDGTQWDADSTPPSIVFWEHILVPARVVDLAFLPDGALLVLSGGIGQPVVLTRVELALDPSRPGWGTATTQVLGAFPDESLSSRLSLRPDGGLAFVTTRVGGPHLPTFVVVHATDGRSAWTEPGVSSAELHPEPAELIPSLRPWLGPDGATLVVVNGGRAFIGSQQAGWSQLATDARYDADPEHAGAAWSSDAVALWRGTPIGSAPEPGTLEAFERAAPHARRFRYDVAGATGGSTGPSGLRGVIAVGDRWVVTTSTGIRVLSADGRLIGGADPLPCRLTPAGQAVETGPNHVAVPAGGNIYVFDLSTMDQPSWP